MELQNFEFFQANLIHEGYFIKVTLFAPQNKLISLYSFLLFF